MPAMAAFDPTKNPPPCVHPVAIPKDLWQDWIQGSNGMQHAFELWRHRQDALISHLVDTHRSWGADDMAKDMPTQLAPRAPTPGPRLAPTLEPPNIPVTSWDELDAETDDEEIPSMEQYNAESKLKKVCWDDSDGSVEPKSPNIINSNGALHEKPGLGSVRELSTRSDESRHMLTEDDSCPKKELRATEIDTADDKQMKNRESAADGHGNEASQGEAVAQRLEAFMEWWNTVEEPPHTGFLAKIVLSGKFATLCPIVILLDTILTAYQANYQANDIYAPRTDAVRVIELCFLCFYVIEICLKLAVHRGFFFINADMKWNIFDTILVLQGVLDNVLSLVVDDDGADLTFARLLRLMKLGKIFRLFRAVRFLRDLRVMLFSIMSSFPALFWAAITLGLILYIFALMFVQAMTTYQIESDQTGRVISEKMIEDIDKYYGSVEKACLTLYKVSSGGKDWEIPYNVVLEAGVMYNLAYIFFIMFFNFAVLNILTGIFMEKALHNTRPDRDSQALEQRRADEKERKELAKLFFDLSGEDGVMTREEFTYHMRDLDVRSTLINLGLEVRDADMFFNILTAITGKDACQIEDFVHYCSRMKGNATSIDLQSLAFEVKVMHRHVKRLAEIAAEQEEKRTPVKGRTASKASQLVKQMDSKQRRMAVSHTSTDP